MLGFRRWLDMEVGEAPGATQAASWLDVKRTYMALRPQLRRIYVVVRDARRTGRSSRSSGSGSCRSRCGGESAGRPTRAVVLDFGPQSVDGWLANLVGAELGITDTVDPGARELIVRGATVKLTPLEFQLLSHLRQREGKTVSRTELLHEVWGTAYTGGSNVVDAVVRSLRRKLGSAAPAVETVRGAGYRLRPDWQAFLG